MKFALFTLTVAGLAAAGLDGIPSCVKPCIEKALAQSGCTGSAQEVAMCGCKPETQAKLLSPVTQCATENNCSPADLLTAQKVATEQCKALASGAGAGAGAGAKVSSVPTAPGMATPTPTVPVPATHTNTNTLAPSSSTPSGSLSTASSNGTSGSTTPTGSKSGATPTPTNGAAAMGPAAGALVALFAAAFAL